MAANNNQIENRLWAAADELRANSKLKSSEYAVPVLGLIFLRYADHRFGAAQKEIEGKSTGRRKIGPADYQAKGVLYLPEEARFSSLLKLPEGSNIGQAINDAMRAVEAENRDLKDVLPKSFNRVDKDRLKDDPRFPYGLPRVDNANYLWIQIFYSALNATGRAGFVMANSASDARGSELEIRKKLIQDQAVDVMVAVGSNFFYTVTLPCTLWFLDRGKRTLSGPTKSCLSMRERFTSRWTAPTGNSPPSRSNSLGISPASTGGKNRRTFMAAPTSWRRSSRTAFTAMCPASAGWPLSSRSRPRAGA